MATSKKLKVVPSTAGPITELQQAIRDLGPKYLLHTSNKVERKPYRSLLDQWKAKR